jgi:uncharacterized delta-60 repeat protein
MGLLKSMYFKFSFMSVFAGIFLAFFLVGCGQNGDQQTRISAGTENNFSSPLPAQLEKARPGLTAKVIVDGGTPFPLQIVNDQVQGTIPDLPIGPHTFEIQYFIDGVLVATATVNATIQAGTDTPVPFDSTQFVFPDADGDGASNLNEVEIFGSGSNAPWNDATKKPELSVVVNPETAILPPNGVQTFTAAIAQNTNQGITWSVQGDNAGTITPGGTYTAPELPGTYNVVATSQADTAKSAIISVTVVKPATIDSTFDADGIVTTNIGSSSFIAGLAVQTDGKIVAVGQSGSHFALVRYNTNGSPDTTFGPSNTGIVTLTTIGTSSVAMAVALQPDGKIVVGGQAASHFTLLRYNDNGTLDTTFDGDGIATTTIGNQSTGFDLVIQGDGKIILAGQSNPTSGGTILALARYNTNGSLDTTFDADGIVTGPIGFMHAVALQSDGKIVVGGLSANHFTLVRYNDNGSLDTTFDGDGIATTTIGTASSIVLDLAVQPDGKIVALGRSTSGTATTVALARYNNNGILDTTFSTDGIVTTTISINPVGFQTVAIQTDGKILSGGNLSLARFNTDGTPDNTFDADGFIATTIGTGISTFDLALQSDGKAIIGGQVGSHFTLARFQTAAPAVLLRANLTGDQEIQIPPVTTSATGSATFIISPGQSEITYTLSTDLSFGEIGAVQIHLAPRGQGGGAVLSTLTGDSFISPLTGKLIPSDLEPSAGPVAGIKTFSDLIKAMVEGRTYVHVHTEFHRLGEIRGQIEAPPPTLSALQAQIFTPKCASCHNPDAVGGDTANLFLDSVQTSFDDLVNAPSTQSAIFKRVEPFKPDESYLIKKLEGTAPVPFDSRMPLVGPPLSADEIKLTRDWISAGAKND